MRVWPSSFEGLHLSLSPGWYLLPTHIEGDERRRLLELIAAGVEDIAYVAELEWDALDTLGQRLELRQTLALVRVPASVEMSDAVLRELRAKLGSVRVGLVQSEAPGDWPELAWQERQIKAPLLEWLRQQLHMAEHPLARLDLRTLPVDEVARYTPEPVELLVMLEGVIAHRMRYFADGVSAEDWERSIVQVGLERFASRLGTIGEPQAAMALELVIVRRDEAVVSLAENQVGARALAHAGLASIGGSDVLLGPLAQFAGQRDKLPRLLILLPDSAWSPMSRRELGRAMPPLFMLPRAVLVAPEPPYSRWPALIPPLPEALELLPDLAPFEGDEEEDWFAQLFEGGALSQQRTRPNVPEPPWTDGVLTLLAEIGDLRRLELDVERGGFHRFDAIDRDWSEAEEGPEIRAYLRWLALSLLLRHVRGAAALALIEDEVTRALELASSPGLRAALHALCGDVHASASRYSMALAAWERAANGLSLSHTAHHMMLGRYRLTLRRILGHLRLDQVNAAWALSPIETAEDSHFFYLLGDEADVAVRFICHELLTLASVWAERLAAKVAPEFDLDILVYNALPPWVPSVSVTQAAAALELGDWPRALALTRTIDPTLESPEGGRALLLLATIKGAVGEVDEAASMAAKIRERASADADALLLALSNRALASFPDPSRDPSEYQAALEAAIKLELKLELPDAHLIEIERAGWALARGTIEGEQYQATLDRLSPVASSSPSLAAASMQAQLRMIALFIASARARGEVPAVTLLDGLVALVADGVRGEEISPWFGRACEELLELARALVDDGSHDQASELLAATRRLAAADARYLAEVERLEARVRA